LKELSTHRFTRFSRRDKVAVLLLVAFIAITSALNHIPSSCEVAKAGYKCVSVEEALKEACSNLKLVPNESRSNYEWYIKSLCSLKYSFCDLGVEEICRRVG